MAYSGRMTSTPRPWSALMSSSPLRLLLLLVAAILVSLLTSTGGPAAAATVTDGVECDEPSHNGWHCYVPENWVYTPPGMGAGDSFRLMFITNERRDSQSRHIGDYDSHVQWSARRNSALAPFADHFRVLASAQDMDAPGHPIREAHDHTRTREHNLGAGDTPIYWLNSARVSADYAGLYDGAWDAYACSAVTNEFGRSEATPNHQHVATGSSSDGGASEPTRFPGVSEPTRGILGGPYTRVGWVCSQGEELAGVDGTGGGDYWVNFNGIRFYAISPVMTVTPRATDCSATGDRCTVTSDWPLVPEGVKGGESFRLMFITSKTTRATARDIRTYNDHVISSAFKNVDLAPYARHFRALGAAWDVHAKPNTRTRASDPGASAPIYWVKGPKVADGYADLYDESWAYTQKDGLWPTDERGRERAIWYEEVWTGTDTRGEPVTHFQLGNDRATFGKPNIIGDELRGYTEPDTTRNARDSKPLYAVSPRITVEPPPVVTGIAITSTPGGDLGAYRAGDTIRVAVAMSEPVTLSGQGDGLELEMVIGDDARKSRYRGDALTGYVTDLAFDFEVRAGDRDGDGVAISQNGLRLRGSATLRNADGANANLSHAAVYARGHKVAYLPSSPAGLYARSGEAGEVSLGWDDPADGRITGYDVARKKASDAAFGPWQAMEHAGRLTTGYGVTGLDGGVEYEFKVRARSEDGPGPASAVVTALAGHGGL